VAHQNVRLHERRETILATQLHSCWFTRLAAGFIYDVMFAGIPYQDPTPEMSARYAHHAHIASAICWLGVAVLLFGVIAGISRLVVRRLGSPRQVD
jgi:hypothetical protein